MSPPVWRDAVTKKGLSSRVKMFDKNLVHAIIGGKDLDCGSAELSVNLVLTRGHGSLLLGLIILPANSLQRLSKRQFVAVRIEHVEVAFALGRVAWDFGMESSLLQVCPERIPVRDVEDQPAPARHCVTLFEV